MELFLGIDTSCYTTSLAVVDGGGNLLSEARQVLSVPAGGRGLAQSEAVFQHIGNLPKLFKDITDRLDQRLLRGISFSSRPRPVPGSYMPVFRVAESFGLTLGTLLQLPTSAVSHQEGHLAAGIWSARGPANPVFLAVHVSGGTTEILRVTRESPGFKIELLGGSADLHAGQFIDRIGVRLGLSFPAGPHLERIAGESRTDLTVPSSVKGYQISFSGPEAQALRLVGQGLPDADIAKAVEQCVANSLEKVIRKGILETGVSEILVVGGVAANRRIRERLRGRLEHQAVGGRLFFADPEFSSDNAVGTALLGMWGFSMQVQHFRE